MYTQCPDCEIAFRVTADVLKQAAGKVRCGGCGNAFNALEYLSEQMPTQAAARVDDTPLPELKPEISGASDGLPKSISAEQSAALLKTLDQLAGSDVRIEDTGVEWRVLDDDEQSPPAARQEDMPPSVDGNSIDELLDDDPTPVDEFLTATPDVLESPEIFAEADVQPARASVDELRFDDNTPLPDDFGVDTDSAAEESAVEEADDAEPIDVESIDLEPIGEPSIAADPLGDIALSEPEEWSDILGEFEDLADSIAEPAVLVDEPIDEPIDEPVDEPVDEPIEPIEERLDTELDHKPPPDPDIAQLELIDDHSEFDEIDEEEFDDEQLIEKSLAENFTVEEELAALEGEFNSESDDSVEEQIDHVPAVSADESADDSGDKLADQHVPAMTEEEHTLNMQIDQDLMALAVEDEDGFASTIVIAQDEVEKDTTHRNSGSDDFFADNHGDADSREVDDAGSGNDEGAENVSSFESIIMEGEFVRTKEQEEAVAANSAAAAEISATVHALEAEQATSPGSKRYKMAAAAVFLALLFAVQLMHQSREALATIPAFSNTVGQVYRVLGSPVQPAWDITAWRIEASNDSIDVQDGEESLTVYSRIGNQADHAMPYPLVNITLTDRFLEPVGSQILDPVEYLPTDLDPLQLVEPDNTFNAVIKIKSPSIDAAGYKVDVCYRHTDGLLHCAVDDFK